MCVQKMQFLNGSWNIESKDCFIFKVNLVARQDVPICATCLSSVR